MSELRIEFKSFLFARWPCSPCHRLFPGCSRCDDARQRCRYCRRHSLWGVLRRHSFHRWHLRCYRGKVGSLSFRGTIFMTAPWSTLIGTETERWGDAMVMCLGVVFLWSARSPVFAKFGWKRGSPRVLRRQTHNRLLGAGAFVGCIYGMRALLLLFRRDISNIAGFGFASMCVTQVSVVTGVSSAVPW